jgi:hypothetical protein
VVFGPPQEAGAPETAASVGETTSAANAPPVLLTAPPLEPAPAPPVDPPPLEPPPPELDDLD